MSNNDYTMIENIHEKWMSALQLHSAMGDRDLGACDLALGMALGELDAAWQRKYDELRVFWQDEARSVVALTHKIGAMTASTVAEWRNGSAPASEAEHPAAINVAAVAQAISAQIHGAAPGEADEDTAPLSLAAMAGDDEDDDDDPPFRYTWEGTSPEAQAAIAGLTVGRPWRAVNLEAKKEILMATIRELQAAQHDSTPLTIADFDRSRPHWMPTFPPLSQTFGMTWTQMRLSATGQPSAA